MISLRQRGGLWIWSSVLAAGLGLSLAAPAPASVINTCHKKVTVSYPSSAKVSVKVEVDDPACTDPPFAGEFVTLTTGTTAYGSQADGVTDQNGVVEISYTNTGVNVHARACATPQDAPLDLAENYYCEYSP